MIIISNAFSINMLESNATLRFEKLTVEEAKRMVSCGFVSIVGHEATSKIFSEILSVEVPTNRISYKMKRGDILIVGCLGARLPEGKVLDVEEMKNFPVTFWKIEII